MLIKQKINMTNEQILKKAIEKAVKNDVSWHEGNYWLKEFKGADKDTLNMLNISAEIIIFSHDFAKAIWGEKEWGCVDCLKQPEEPYVRNMPHSEYTEECIRKKHSIKPLYTWKHHLPIMVMQEEPLKYLEKFI